MSVSKDKINKTIDTDARAQIYRLLLGINIPTTPIIDASIINGPKIEDTLSSTEGLSTNNPSIAKKPNKPDAKNLEPRASGSLFSNRLLLGAEYSSINITPYKRARFARPMQLAAVLLLVMCRWLLRISISLFLHDVERS